MKPKLTTNHQLSLKVPDSFRDTILQSNKDCALKQIESIQNIFTFIKEKAFDHEKNREIFIDKREFDLNKEEAFTNWKFEFDYPS